MPPGQLQPPLRPAVRTPLSRPVRQSSIFNVTFSMHHHCSSAFPSRLRCRHFGNIGDVVGARKTQTYVRCKVPNMHFIRAFGPLQDFLEHCRCDVIPHSLRPASGQQPVRRRWNSQHYIVRDGKIPSIQKGGCLRSDRGPARMCSPSTISACLAHCFNDIERVVGRRSLSTFTSRTRS